MRHVFVCGCGRSGTTLLGSMLGAHSRCIATPESKFLMPAYRTALTNDGDGGDWLGPTLSRLAEDWTFGVWGIAVPSIHEHPSLDVSGREGFPAFVEDLVRRYGQQVGKQHADVWVDHTPDNMRRAAALNDLFPDARLIHLIRDGRAVASSVKPLDWGPNTSAACARWWMDGVAMGSVAEEFFRERAIRIRFEDLVREPDVSMRYICEFLDLDYEADMDAGSGFRTPEYTRHQHGLVGRPPEVTRIEAWRQGLTERDIEIFESIAHDFLSVVGYVPLYGITARPRTATERTSQFARERIYGVLVNPQRHRRRIKRTVGPQGGSAASRRG